MADVYLKNKKSILIWLIGATYTALFFPIQVSNISLIILIAFCIIAFDGQQTLAAFRESMFLKLMLGMYLMQIIGLLYTNNLPVGLFMLEKKISFVLIPLFLLPLFRTIGNDRETVLKVIGVVTILSSLILLIIALYRKVILNDPAAFFYGRNLSEGFTPIHYPYYSMYFACGSIMLLDSLFETLTKKKYGMIFIFLIFIYSLSIIILVASKTGIAAFLIASFFFLYVKITNKKVFIFSSFLLALSGFALLYFNQTTLDRFSEINQDISVLFLNDLRGVGVDLNGLTMRLLFWKIQIIHLWRDGLIFAGVGTGDAQDYINSLFQLPQYEIPSYSNWDSHNQWIFTLIQLGILGIAMMGALYARYIYSSVKNGDFAFLSFLLITFSFSLSESILESNKGIVFFSLLCTLLACSSNKKATPSEANILSK